LSRTGSTHRGQVVQRRMAPTRVTDLATLNSSVTRVCLRSSPMEAGVTLFKLPGDHTPAVMFDVGGRGCIGLHDATKRLLVSSLTVQGMRT